MKIIPQKSISMFAGLARSVTLPAGLAQGYRTWPWHRWTTPATWKIALVTLSLHPPPPRPAPPPPRPPPPPAPPPAPPPPPPRPARPAPPRPPAAPPAPPPRATSPGLSLGVEKQLQHWASISGFWPAARMQPCRPNMVDKGDCSGR